MAGADEYVAVFVMASSEEEATRIGRSVVEERLAACANILPGVTSVFHWEGKIEEASECLLILKTRRALFRVLADRVKALHSYQVPEIVAVSLAEGWPDYLAWVGTTCRP